MASRIIGVLGKKRHGKDTFATRLTAEHGFTRFAFADALREAALKLNPLVRIEQDETYLYPQATTYPGFTRLGAVVGVLGWDAAKEIREVRRTLQRIGVGVRDLDPDFWVRVVMQAVDAHAGPVVITDVRFLNEVYAVIARRGRTVRVLNPRVAPSEGAEHVSETALDHYAPHHLVRNEGTIEDLHKQADRLAYLS